MNTGGFQEQLQQRAERAGLRVRPELSERLAAYFRLLAVWNRKINLTGADLEAPSAEAIDRLFVEPLMATRYVPAHASSMIDIGSGGGSPALPMALAVPRLSRLVMVESRARKAVFLREAVRALGLTHCDVVNARFEALLEDTLYRGSHDLVTVRAVRVDVHVLSQLEEFLAPSGSIFLFRGIPGGDSLATVPAPLDVAATVPLISEAASKLVILRKRSGWYHVPRGT